MANRKYISYPAEYPRTKELHTSVTAAFVTLLSPASWESDVGLGRFVDTIGCNDSGVFSGVFAFKEKNLRNSTRCIDPIKLKKVLEGRLGVAWQNLGETPWRSYTNY